MDKFSRRTVLTAIAANLAAPVLIGHSYAQEAEWTTKLVNAARSQIGVTTLYDPAYRAMDFPGGDIDRQRGVCTDVVIRAYRDAFDIDLQKLVNDDMTAAFGTYPKIWGLSRPDPNIDHRRVPNLEHFFTRKGAALDITDDPANYQPGDIVSQRLPNNAPHIGIVDDSRTYIGNRPHLIHNIGLGTRREDRVFSFTITGHFRFSPEMA